MKNINQRNILLIVLLVILITIIGSQIGRIKSVNYYYSSTFKEDSVWFDYFVDVFFINNYRYPKNYEELLQFLDEDDKYFNQTGKQIDKELIKEGLYILDNDTCESIQLISKGFNKLKNKKLINLNSKPSFWFLLSNDFDYIIVQKEKIKECTFKPKAIDVVFLPDIEDSKRKTIINKLGNDLNHFRFLIFTGNNWINKTWDEKIGYLKVDFENDSLNISWICDPLEANMYDKDLLLLKLDSLFRIPLYEENLKCFYFPIIVDTTSN